ncbi:MAG: glycosyltransferase family 9 protein [Gemmatimonadetes bacterium]|nr:glycosyltransferase family 9 protein [Gemmatimonadota bacterium]
MPLPEGFCPGRVVIVRPRGLGDVVLSSAVIDALTRAWPDARLDFITERASRELLEPDARLDGIFLLDGEDRDARIRGGGLRSAVSWVRERSPDLLLDLFSNPRTAWLTAMSGVPFRVGLDKRVRRFAYNVRVPRFHGPPEEDHRWARDVQLDFLRNAGIRWAGEAKASVALTPEDAAFAERVLPDLGYAPGTSFATVLPGGSWESKRWSVEGFAAAGRAAAECLGAPTLVCWGPPEREDAEAIASRLGDAGRLAPPSRLREMAALLARSALTVSTDCLGRHFAVVQGVPTVGIFGTTDPRDWTPPDGPHRTVRGGPEEGYPSLRDFPADAVVAAVRDLLAEVDSGRAPL